MLLLKKDTSFQEGLEQTFKPFVILPVFAETVKANDLALDARIEGRGVTVLHCRDGSLFVIAADNESQCVGFARKVTRESKRVPTGFFFCKGRYVGPGES